jgi:predicted ribosomally synthesized peptide with nif11-like leader
MSLDQARLFIEKMKSDEAFAKRVMAIEDVAARLACIQSEGFDFSEAEIKEVSGELTDTELDSAVGAWRRGEEEAYSLCSTGAFGFGYCSLNLPTTW